MSLRNLLRSLGAALLALSLPVHPLTAQDAVKTDAATTSPAIAFSARSVTVTDVTPVSKVILFGILRDPVPYAVSAHNFTLAQASDASGSVTFDLNADIAGPAIFAAVDYDSGRYALAASAGQTPRIITLPKNALKKKDEEYQFLELETRWLEGLCVRPKKGAWSIFVTDGARLDHDGDTDGMVLIDAAEMHSLVGEEVSPRKFRPHDVVIVIDPRRMDVIATEVNE